MLKRTLCSITSANASLWLTGLMFLLPFVIVYHQQPIPSFYAEWIAATLGLLALLPLIKKSVWQQLKIPQIAMVVPGLAAIVGMQWMLGMLHSNQYALLVLSYLAWAFLLMVLGGYLRRELGWEKLAITLAWCLVAAGVINAGFVAVQYAMRSGLAISFMPQLNSYGAISQANHFADFTALATASLIYLYAKGRFQLKTFAGILVLFLIMLSFSGSRSSWLYLAALTTLAVIMQVNAMRQRAGSTAMRSLLRVSLLLLPAFAVIHFFVYHLLPNELGNLPTERLVDAATSGASSPRLHLWYDSLRLFLQSPWLGVGAGAMSAETFLLIDTPTAMASKRIFEHAHNLFLHLLAEMGIGAFLLVLVGLVAWVRAFKWRELGLETWWLIAMLAVLGIHSMLEYPLWFAYFLGVAAVLLGAGDEKPASISLPEMANRLGQGAGQLAARSALVVVLVLGAANLSTMLIANIKLESWLQQSMNEEMNEDVIRQQSQIDWVHQYSLLSPYAELMYTISMAVNPGYIDDKIWLSQSAMRFKPMRKIAYQHVLLLKLQGDHAGAVKQLNRTLIAHPGDFKGELEAMPFRYWQHYLDVLSEARPIPIKTSL